ncbi:MAG TPA: GNAT family N-acetyltransferase [Edaphocola sp.]|nr:GNAT family N-acetyltransferase [Edaphocola sp.]
MTKFVIEDNGKKGKVVLFEEEKKAGEIVFSWTKDDQLLLEHTEVNEAFGGKGYGKLLVMEFVTYARNKKAKVIPMCSYAIKVFEKEVLIQDVLA